MAESKSLKYLKVITDSNKNKTYAFSIITIVILLVMILGAIQPTISTILRINTEIKKKQEINIMLENKMNALNKLGNEYDSIRDKTEYLPLLFPTQGNFSLLLTNMDVIVKEMGYKLVAISFGTNDKYKAGTAVLVPWNLRLSIEGNRANLIPLLERIESLPTAPVITNVSFARGRNDSSSSIININVIIYKIEDLKFYQ